ncbi:Acetoacetate metabolism regulatory protein AtoC [Nitrospira sp. KM1]|uniref:sigma-54-dependent transcriptional regulator n=1 Tax=Nitrospira sp. KM1 TaxID=1936990 RepID=UPI0013A790B4|nr:sigma-54 dependent transcriptional regulator [Nitrospira sp. KM1]BCA56171.1 Acetoacetate metabolism regulatory protein AtoC [Nitrospira sp. KM1]
MQATIFVTDDEHAIRSALVKRLTRKGHRASGYESGDALLAAVDREQPDLVLLDLKMPGLNGLDTLKKVRPLSPHSLFIMLTAYGTVQDAVEAIKLGAYDFLIKTVELDGVDPVVDRALDLLTLRRRVEFEAEHHESQFSFSTVEAHSQSMQRLMGQVKDVAENPKSTVLLQGETGTGKEFLARVIHHNGPRANGAFVGVNCTAIPKELFESELFGYERGAFTGAHQRKIGLLEKAEGGTLFLDEIGDLDLSMQAKLLRVLQERSFRRLGGTEDIAVDFRLIAATNRDLKRAVTSGTFREDLFFRLNVITFELPPLRNRVEDILPLCRQSLIRYAKEFGRDVLDFDPAAQTMLERYNYPGNIRELQNIIERGMIFCREKMMTVDCLPIELRVASKPMAQAVTQGQDRLIRLEMQLGKQTLAEMEQAIIDEVMRVSDQNKSLAAKHLGLTRFALDRRLKKVMEP